MLSTPEIQAHAQEVLDYITEYPERHDQRMWITGGTDPNICGTTMCISGTSIYLKQGLDYLLEGADNEFDGAKNLGLTYAESQGLFYTMDKSVARDAVIAIADGDEKKFHDLTGYDPETEQDSYWGQ